MKHISYVSLDKFQEEFEEMLYMPTVAWLNEEGISMLEKNKRYTLLILRASMTSDRKFNGKMAEIRGANGINVADAMMGEKS